MLWMICGAGQGAGKTFVAKRLCAILPDAVYAKLGHGDKRTGKPENYFQSPQALAEFLAGQTAENLVVEAHTFTPTAPSLVVFLDCPQSNTQLREDAAALAARADIVVRATGSRHGWERVLTRVLTDPALIEAVLGILAEQQRRLIPALAVRSKAWLINENDQHVFGAGIADLLEDIELLGSLRAAALHAGMSYRYAWGALKTAEDHLSIKLLKPSRQGSRLTSEGKRILGLYRQLNDRIALVADQEFSALFAALRHRQESH